MAAVPVSADVGVAVGSAVIAAGSAVPFLMTVDKSVTLAAAGRMGLGEAILSGLKDVFSRPHQMLTGRAFWLVAAVYGSTYTAANLIDLAAERREATTARQNSAKLVGTTAVNTCTSVVKDAAFAKMFGQVEAAAKRAVPPSSYGLFLTRDILQIGAGFIVPPMLAGTLVSAFHMEQKKADQAAQLVCPVAMQFICTPLHLLGLNMYNQPEATARERAAGVWRTCPESIGIRMARSFFAFGFAGVANRELTARGKAWARERYCTKAA